MKTFLLPCFAFLALTITSAIVEATANKLPRNCNDVLVRAGRNHVPSGVYTIYPTNKNASGAQVFCDMETSEGGWIVIQRRRETDGGPQIDFYRHWSEYVNGFGSLEGSHWLGLDLISSLTSADGYRLRIDMMDWEGEERFMEYIVFYVSNSTDNYRLTVGGYSGNAGDSITPHDNMPFSTKDRDNDAFSGNCAQLYKSGWWYHSCLHSNLNGVYGSWEFGEGVNWGAWHGLAYSLKRVEMKIQLI